VISSLQKALSPAAPMSDEEELTPQPPDFVPSQTMLDLCDAHKTINQALQKSLQDEPETTPEIPSDATPPRRKSHKTA
jgi:hypothetical protein